MKQVICFATEAHTGQVRKYTGEPYIKHPLSVGFLVRRLYPIASDDMVKAAILHDVVEDTDTTIEEIQQRFGGEVAELVGWLTDVPKPEDGNRKIRKALDRQHTANAPFEAQIIKLADLIDNTSSIVKHDPSFAKVYLREKAQILDAMRDDVKQTHIWKEATAILFTATKAIK